MARTAAIRQLIEYAARGGASVSWLDRVACDLVKLQLDHQELRRLIDPRKLETLQRAKDLAAEIARYQRAGDCEHEAVMKAKRRHRLPKSSWHRLLMTSRELRDAIDLGSSQVTTEDTNMDLKKLSLGIGTTPASLPKISNPKPNPPALDTPRDGGGMSTGSTSGNFDLGSMTKIGLNAGPTGSNPGADQSIAAQAENAK